jgi:hypothetical protein
MRIDALADATKYTGDKNSEDKRVLRRLSRSRRQRGQIKANGSMDGSMDGLMDGWTPPGVEK